MRKSIAFVFTVALAALTLGGSARSQQPLPPVTQQELAQQKYAELSESMERLHAYLAKSGNEDELNVLRNGMTLAQEKRIDESMARIKGQLQNERWDDALQSMQAVRKDLLLLLEVLQNRDTDLQELLAQIARLEAWRKEVDRLAKEQGEEKDDSARAEALQQHLAAMAAAKATAEQILAEQQALRERTNALGLQVQAQATEPLAQKEGELEAETKALAADLEAIEKQAAELAAKADGAQAAAGEPKAGEPEAGEPKAGEPKAGPPSATGKPGGCSSCAKGAAGAMQQAQQQLGEQKAEQSLKDQDQAIDKLKATVAQLETMAEATRRELEKLPFDQQARRQEATEHATDTLAKKMEKSEQDGETGDGSPTPGRKSVQQAVPKQKAAAGSLKEHKPAKQKQQDAKEDLEKARDELDEAINQLRQQLADEVLRALEERFTAMLARQRDLSLQTKTLDTTRGRLDGTAELPAALIERIQAIAEGEQDLELEAEDAGKLLAEDGTTSVFPALVDELQLGLHSVTKLCRGNATGADVQELQLEVEETLAMLINALRRTIEEREAGQPGQCNGQPQLVPVSAELKVLKFLQERVNKRTKDFDARTPADQRDSDPARAAADELAAKEAHVRELTRRLAAKLNGEEQR